MGCALSCSDPPNVNACLQWVSKVVLMFTHTHTVSTLDIDEVFDSVWTSNAFTFKLEPMI